MLCWTFETFGRPVWLAPLCVLLAWIAGPGAAPPARAQEAAPPMSGEALYRGLILAHGPVAERIPEIRDHFMARGSIRDAYVLRGLELFHDRLVGAIAARRPGFFAAFAESVTSGDHLRIAAALREAAGVTLEAVRQMPEVAPLRRALREDPARVRALVRDLKRVPAARHARVDEETLRRAVGALVAESLEESAGEEPSDMSSSLVAVLFVAVVAVAAVTVATVASYAGAVNVAGAINFALAVVATIHTGVSGGGNPRRDPDRDGLLGEQMIDSIARLLRAGGGADAR